MSKKPKKPNLSSRKKLAQQYFNKFIRERDMDENGETVCISCGKTITKSLASHYFAVKQYPHMRFDERNVHGGCWYCNMHLHGNLIPYRKNLIELYGEDDVHQLEMDGFNPPEARTAKEELEYVNGIIEKYKNN